MSVTMAVKERRKRSIDDEVLSARMNKRQILLHALLVFSLLAGQNDAFTPSGVSRTQFGRTIKPSLLERRRHSTTRQILSRSASTKTSSSSSSAEKLLLSNDEDSSSISTTPHGLEPPFKVTLDGEEEYSYSEAIQRTLGWVGAATVFGGGMWAIFGSRTGEEFFAGYLVEQSLSVDNLFVFLLLFEYFRVPIQYQDRVLNWGIYGAVVMRAIMIGLGAAAIHNFRAILLVFAAILVYSSGKFFVGGDEEEEDPSENSIVKFSRSLFPSTDYYDGDRFFTLAADGIRKATPLFICMVAVEISDIVFAVDSIPAVFGVTENPLVVFSSNIFAIMGLRSLYTILSKAATDLKYLEPAVALVLGFIGVKMVLEYFGYCIPTQVALGVVATSLSAGVGLSVLDKQRALEANNSAGEQAESSTPSE